MCRRLNVNNNNIVISFKEHRKICILLQTSHIPRSTSYPVPTNYNYNYRHPPQLCTQEEWHGAALVAEEVRRIGVANIYVGAGLRQRHSIITILYLGNGNGAQWQGKTLWAGEMIVIVAVVVMMMWWTNISLSLSLLSLNYIIIIYVVVGIRNGRISKRSNREKLCLMFLWTVLFDVVGE